MRAVRPIHQALLLAAVLLAALAVAQPVATPGVPEAPGESIQRLEQSIDLLGKRLLASRLEVDALKSQVGSLEGRAVLQQREIDRLSARLAMLEFARPLRRR